MENPKLLILAISSTLLLSACQATPLPITNEVPITPSTQSTPAPTPEPPIPTSPQIILDKPFTLKPGQTANFEPNNSTITFVSVESDSRCPSGAQCVWAGEATLNLKITGFKPTSDNIDSYSITTMDNILTLGFGNASDSYNLELTDVTPYPGLSKPNPAGTHEATFILKKSDS